jgi:RNA polymerase sigma-70 factor (ECF subfamily)
MHSTSASLLERLRVPGEREAWDRFVALYTPLLLHWSRRLEGQESNAVDLVQDVLAILVKEMPRFQYHADRRFRGWLWTVTRNRWRELCRRRAGVPVALTDSALENAALSDDQQAFDEAEYRQYIVNRALQLMQADFQPDTWKACWEYVVRDRPAVEVAAELGITVNAVHLAKSRVLRRLREELKELLD